MTFERLETPGNAHVAIPTVGTGSRKLRWAGFLLGFSLGGFFDGILLHQVLQWHHLLSNVQAAALRRFDALASRAPAPAAPAAPGRVQQHQDLGCIGARWPVRQALQLGGVQHGGRAASASGSSSLSGSCGCGFRRISAPRKA